MKSAFAKVGQSLLVIKMMIIIKLDNRKSLYRYLCFKQNPIF